MLEWHLYEYITWRSAYIIIYVTENTAFHGSFMAVLKRWLFKRGKLLTDPKQKITSLITNFNFLLLFVYKMCNSFQMNLIKHQPLHPEKKKSKTLPIAKPSSRTGIMCPKKLKSLFKTHECVEFCGNFRNLLGEFVRADLFWL